jgi:hypothetical protein
MTEEAESRILGPNHLPEHVFSALLQAEVVAPAFRATIESSGDSVLYADLEEKLFISLVRFLLSKNPRAALRTIEIQMGVSRSVISRRIRDAVKKGLLREADLPMRFWRTQGDGSLGEQVVKVDFASRNKRRNKNG